MLQSLKHAILQTSMGSFANDSAAMDRGARQYAPEQHISINRFPNFTDIKRENARICKQLRLVLDVLARKGKSRLRGHEELQ